MHFMTILMLVLGLVGLVIGGELLIRGAVAIARHLGVSPLMIGITLVGFGTSTPELVTCIQAALAGSPGLAVGNIVGSNTANILVILGLAAVVRPVRASRAAFKRDGSALMVATLLVLALTLYGAIDRLAGAVLCIGLVVYLVLAYVQEQKSHDATAEGSSPDPATSATARSLTIAIACLIGGLLLTVVGARFLVDGAIELALELGVSDTIIGLTLVAIGTSLPELITSVMAAWRGQSDVAFGNVVGSCIYNLLGILGLTALVTPIAVPIEIAGFDIWVMLAATLALVVATVTGWRVTRLEGYLLLVGYAAYLGYLVMTAATPV